MAMLPKTSDVTRLAFVQQFSRLVGGTNYRWQISRGTLSRMKKAFVRLRPIDIVDAASEGDIDHIRAILDRYPGQVDIEHNGQTAMQLAAHKGHIDIIKLLASPEYCADVDLCDSDFRTPLHYAVNGNQPTVVELLLNLGAKMEEKNIRGETPPQIAFTNQQKECVKIFLERERNVCLINQNGVSKSRIGPSGRLKAEDAEPSDQEREKKFETMTDPCTDCEDYPACITYEPCGCKISCFVCSLKHLACTKCGSTINKRSYADDARVKAFFNEIKETKQQVRSFLEKDTCTICTTAQINCTLQCGHMFCIPCVRKNPVKDNWGKTVRKCPVCRESSRYTRVFLPNASNETGHR